MQNPPASSASAQQPLISFIVTYYNLPPQLLGACIDSILALSLTPEEREIIVIDDGSEESPLETLREKWNDILYIRQQNQGLSAARNLGIEACRGTFIQFVDGDDLLNTSIYEQCLDIVRQKDPDIVAFHLSDKEERNMTVEYEGPMEGSEYMRHNNLRASACGYIFRKKTLVNLRFTSGILHEDEEFTPELFLRAEKVYSTNAKAYYYRNRGHSITRKNDKEWVKKRLEDTKGVLYRLVERTDTLPLAEREAMQRRIDQLTMDYLYNVITLTHNGRYLEQCVAELTQKGLFPLPDRDYTQKYKWFRRISSSKAGRRLLCLLITSPTPLHRRGN